MLQQFGFTQYESQAYHALVSSEQPLDATAIVKHSAVPRAKIYDVLQRLADKGMLLQSTDGKKRYYAALPIETAIAKLTADFNKNIAGLKAIEKNTVPQDDRVWTLKDDGTIQAVITELLEKAAATIVISGWADDLTSFKPILNRKHEEGLAVTIHAIGSFHTKIPDITTLIPDLEHVQLERSRLVIVDDGEMIFAGKENDNWQAIRTSSRPLVKFFTEFFYHDVALTAISQKHRDLLMEDEKIRDILLKLRY